MSTLADLLITLEADEKSVRDVYAALVEHLEAHGDVLRDQVIGYYAQGENYVVRAVFLFDGGTAKDLDGHLEEHFGDRDEVLAYDQIGDTILDASVEVFELYVNDASEEDLPEDLRTDADLDAEDD